jgi:coproporphyrinogen dehydrogenase HemZ
MGVDRMTVTLRPIDHGEWDAMADMARLFFGHVEREKAALRAPSETDATVTVRVTPPVDPATARAASRRGTSDETIAIETTCGARSVATAVPLHDIRREIRRTLYDVLSDATGIRFPWGALTGVRPTNVAHQYLMEARDAADPAAAATARLMERAFVSETKAALAVETALAEAAILEGIDASREALLYVGIPFCPTRCAYCSFITQDADRQRVHLGRYVETVIAEAQGLFRPPFSYDIAAVYYGGGTPTSLPPHLLKDYLDRVSATAPLADGAERTVEAGRPDTIDDAKLAIIRAAGFTRLCINPQTMHDATLERIGRHHTVRATVNAYRRARAHGFNVINMDLIAGLPGETPADLLDSVRRLCELDPDAITLHTLAVKRGARLDRDQARHAAFLPDPELTEAVDAAQAMLRAHGYRPYYLYRQKNCRGGLENVGFAKRDGASLYNVAMMSDRVSVVGLGSGASSKAIFENTAKRIHNPKDLGMYMDRVDDQIARKRALLVGEIDV